MIFSQNMGNDDLKIEDRSNFKSSKPKCIFVDDSSDSSWFILIEGIIIYYVSFEHVNLNLFLNLTYENFIHLKNAAIDSKIRHRKLKDIRQADLL